jgi:hypothetical protein
MVEYNSIYKMRKNLISVLKYWAFFWQIFKNITYRSNNRAKAPEVLCSAHIS